MFCNWPFSVESFDGAELLLPPFEFTVPVLLAFLEDLVGGTNGFVAVAVLYN